jgi:acetyltransferase-like isoleucine patch superfamily enzyme
MLGGLQTFERNNMPDLMDKILNKRIAFFEAQMRRILILHGFDIADHESIRERCEMRWNAHELDKETLCIDGKPVADFVTRIDATQIWFDVVPHPPAELCA